MAKTKLRRIVFKKVRPNAKKNKDKPEPKEIPKLQPLDNPEETKNQELFRRARNLYEYQAKKSKLKPEDQQWFNKLLNSGTIADKISAISIAIKEDPKHSLSYIHKLLEIGSVKQREKSIKALFALKDLFIHIILNKGLAIHFDQGEGDDVERYYWHTIYKQIQYFIEIVSKASLDTLSYVRRQSIIIMVELHCAHPIPTQALIPHIVNKFGDKEKVLIQLLTKRLSTELSKKPALTYPIIREVYGFLHRPNQLQETQYYCLNFMNSLNLSTQDPGTLSYMLRIFFILFKKLVSIPEAETNHSKLFSQILRGINKTIPFGQKFVNSLQELYKENEALIFKLIATSENFKIKIQTLYFVYQIQQNLNDHYYRSFYSLLLHSELENTSLAELFFDLFFLSIKQDCNIQRQKAFIKRLLQVAIHSNLAFTITSLICVHKLVIEIPRLLLVEEQTAYDPHKRQPMYSGAGNLDELKVFQQHFHPKVKQIVERIISGSTDILQKTNPLVEYSQSTFMAKFADVQNKKMNRISYKSQSDFKDEDAFKLKYLKQKLLDKKKKPQKIKQRQTDFDDEDEEDNFADELFEKELEKNDIDDGDDFVDDFDDYQNQQGNNDDEELQEMEQEESFQNGNEEDENENENGIDYDEIDDNDLEQLLGVGKVKKKILKKHIGNKRRLLKKF